MFQNWPDLFKKWFVGALVFWWSCNKPSHKRRHFGKDKPRSYNKVNIKLMQVFMSCTSFFLKRLRKFSFALKVTGPDFTKLAFRHRITPSVDQYVKWAEFKYFLPLLLLLLLLFGLAFSGHDTIEFGFASLRVKICLNVVHFKTITTDANSYHGYVYWFTPKNSTLKTLMEFSEPVYK